MQGTDLDEIEAIGTFQIRRSFHLDRASLGNNNVEKDFVPSVDIFSFSSLIIFGFTDPMITASLHIL